MPKYSSCFIAVLFTTVLVARASADTDAIIAKARAYLGPDATLEAITSIHYVGTLASEETIKDKDGKETKRPFNGKIDLIFQKPYLQRVVLVSYKGLEMTGLDDFEAWRRLEPANDPKHASLTLLDKDQVMSQRANTWENIAFYRGIERRGGHVDDLGSHVIDGHNCEKLAFVHQPGLTFYRYFDTTTGQLILTDTENGVLTREYGEMMVNGVRFPKSLVNITKDPATGRENTLTITLDKITLNESFPESIFAVPLFTVK
jgi:outer membrane lipoprotein-sorting protein